MGTIVVKDANNSNQSIELPNSNGRAVAATSRPVTLSTEDFAALNSILGKIISAPATEAKQDTGNTSLASILAKMLATPATEAKQDTGNTALAAILSKILTAPATEAKQDVGNTSLASILAKLIATPATESKQDATNTALTTLATQATLAALSAKFSALGQAAMAASTPVVIASNQSAIPVTQAVLPAGTDRGGSITAGGSAQNAAASNAARLGMTFQNTSDVDMWVSETTTAAVGTGYKVTAGQSVNISTNRAISLFCATSGKTFAGTEW